MSADFDTSFLTYYIRSLGERTREEKSSTKFGFDWIIYNLALADELIPCRLPFIRGGADEISKTKTEPEFGVDLSFISSDKKALYIFVLKDEVLKGATWNANNFDVDLRNAASPNLDAPEFKEVQEIHIILAYNKDEDQTGIQYFDNLTKNLGPTVRGNIPLSFARWNLTAITVKVKEKLLTPSLLPQRFFSLFSYISSQFADFRHGSDAWVQQLIPNWNRFLNDLLKDNIGERHIRLLPVALIILKEQGQKNPSFETGWLDLAEWAMLAIWEVFRTTDNKGIKQAIIEIWFGMYLPELNRFYRAHTKELTTEHSLEIRGSGTYLDPVASAVVAQWHIARMGILAVGLAEFGAEPSSEEEQNAHLRMLNEIADWLIGFMNANPSTMRPILDINHIEQFLIWRTLWQVGRIEDIYKWLFNLQRNLLVRRAKTAWLPFVDGGNSLEIVFEYLTTTEKPPEFTDQSSLLLLCLLEIAFCLESDKRDKLIALYYKQIILAQDSSGNQLKDCEPIDLMGWAPPNDWSSRVLTKSLSDEGESQTFSVFNVQGALDAKTIVENLDRFVKQSREAQKFEFPDWLPASVLVLACLKHQTPLPPELWRLPIWGEFEIGERKQP